MVFERYSDQARQAVELAEAEARRLGHGHLGTEHLLLGILAEGRSAAARALMASGASLQGCRELAAEAVGEQQEVRPSEALPLTDRSTRAMERAARLARRRRDPHVECEHVLLSVMDVEGRAGQVLRGLAVDLVGLRQALEAGSAPAPPEPEPAPASRPDGVAPRCARCEAPLEEALTYQLLSAAPDAAAPAGRSRRFVVAYCSACGAVIGAHPG